MSGLLYIKTDLPNNNNLIMEQAYIIARLKEMTMTELLDALAEAHGGSSNKYLRASRISTN